MNLFWLWLLLWVGLLFLALNPFTGERKDWVKYQWKRLVRWIRRDQCYLPTPEVERRVNEALRRFRETSYYDD